MICFDIELNGRTLTAGIPGLAVLTAIVTWVRRVKDPPAGTVTEDDLTFRVGGLDSNVKPWEEGVHLTWLNARLKVGDCIRLTVADKEVVDPPPGRTGPRGKTDGRSERSRSARHYLKLYASQRELLNRQIRDYRREVAKLEGKGKRRSSGQRKGTVATSRAPTSRGAVRTRGPP